MGRSEEAFAPIGGAVPGWSEREPPRPGPFPGRHCSVVPLRAEHAEALYPSCAGPGNESLWTYLADGPYPDAESFAARVAGTAADPDSVSVAVLNPAGTPVGLANFLRIDPRNGTVEVGGILFGRRLQRTAAATEAMHLMARHVFEELGYRRYEWKCDALNQPSRDAAVRLGFTFEGVFRQAVVYKGRNRDTAWFSITDREWPALDAAHEEWLAPANFDERGRQRRSLSEIRSHAGTQSPDVGTPVTLA
ncbi:GNAT family N-acetyltransferase [Nocardioides mesophilus]|uniref:GNAT family N-acetyltransferase n=1 Tax=Nocardioides mesophilus TaxID=433659 RepID=A0A7G9R8Y3_9ACTN|nr:GNAT family protein [Nocardioides mesophilus]QNN52058.1 GNAT family N-acetyltransferase [Nocardioides mesophilus]